MILSAPVEVRFGDGVELANMPSVVWTTNVTNLSNDQNKEKKKGPRYGVVRKHQSGIRKCPGRNISH